MAGAAVAGAAVAGAAVAGAGVDVAAGVLVHAPTTMTATDNNASSRCFMQSPPAPKASPTGGSIPTNRAAAVKVRRTARPEAWVRRLRAYTVMLAVDPAGVGREDG